MASARHFTTLESALSLIKRLFGLSKLDESHPAFQAGQVIAASLIEGHDPSHINPSETQFLTAASVSPKTYIKERFLLRACACEVAAQTKLHNPPDYTLVRGGIHHWLAFQAKRSEEFRAVYDTYLRRLPMYLAAARKDLASGVTEPDVVRISEVSCSFADALAEACAGDESFRNVCAPLAMVFAPIYWNAQVAGSLILYRQAGLDVVDQ